MLRLYWGKDLFCGLFYGAIDRAKVVDFRPSTGSDRRLFLSSQMTKSKPLTVVSKAVERPGHLCYCKFSEGNHRLSVGIFNNVFRYHKNINVAHQFSILLLGSIGMYT